MYKCKEQLNSNTFSVKIVGKGNMWESVAKNVALGGNSWLVRAEAIEIRWLFRKNPWEPGCWPGPLLTLEDERWEEEEESAGEGGGIVEFMAAVICLRRELGLWPLRERESAPPLKYTFPVSALAWNLPSSKIQPLILVCLQVQFLLYIQLFKTWIQQSGPSLSIQSNSADIPSSFNQSSRGIALTFHSPDFPPLGTL